MKTALLLKTLTATTAMLVTASLTAAPIAPGTVIGIDFSDAGGLQTNFNLVDPADGSSGAAGSGSLAAPLIETSAGTAVDGVAFSWASTSAWFNNPDSLSYPTQPAVFSDASTTDWLGISNSGAQSTPGVITLTFTGLDDALTYDLVIGARFGQNIANTSWTVDGQTLLAEATSDTNAFRSFTGLSTNGSGNLVITGTGATARLDIATVSALHLTAVPEPGSLALLGLGGLLIARRRRD